MKCSTKFFRPGRRVHLAADRLGIEYSTTQSVLSHTNAAAVKREPVQLAVDHGLDGYEEHREVPTPDTQRRRGAFHALDHQNTR
jgi:hypothetical protein